MGSRVGDDLKKMHLQMKLLVGFRSVRIPQPLLPNQLELTLGVTLRKIANWVIVSVGTAVLHRLRH